MINPERKSHEMMEPGELCFWCGHLREEHAVDGVCEAHPVGEVCPRCTTYDGASRFGMPKNTVKR
jgi:hypothetical protein